MNHKQKKCRKHTEDEYLKEISVKGEGGSKDTYVIP